jgi:hypothetical protein
VSLRKNKKQRKEKKVEKGNKDKYWSEREREKKET